MNPAKFTVILLVDLTTASDYTFYCFLNSFFVTMHAPCPHSSHVTNPDMAHVHPVSKAAEWLDGVVGGEGTQEDRREERWVERCEGGQEGAKVDRKARRRA